MTDTPTPPGRLYVCDHQINNRKDQANHCNGCWSTMLHSENCFWGIIFPHLKIELFCGLLRFCVHSYIFTHTPHHVQWYLFLFFSPGAKTTITKLPGHSLLESTDFHFYYFTCLLADNVLYCNVSCRVLLHQKVF